MIEITKLFPENGNDSARITMTNEHTVINGAHFRISNGYTHKQASPATIETKDILSIERQVLRKKRLLVVGLSLFGILLILFGIFGQIERYFTVQAAAEGDPKAQLRVLVDLYGGTIGRELLYDDFAEMFQHDTLDWDDWLFFLETAEITLDAHDAYDKYMDLGTAATGDFSKIRLFHVIKYLTYAILFIPSVLCVGLYTFQPLSILRVKALGGDFAVETKHYQNNDIERFIAKYYNAKSGLS